MAESEKESKSVQWSWVVITFGMYVVFYLLPILYVAGMFENNIITLKAITFIGAWSFGGAVILSAIAGYLSKGVTILEPAIAGVGLVVLWFIAYRILIARYSGAGISEDLPILVATLIIIFVLSLIGAWFGEKVQKSLGTKTPE